MSQTHLAGTWNVAAANQAGILDGVMRGAKRALHQERLILKQPCGAENFGRLKGFFIAQQREYARKALSQHRFASTRRTNHQNIIRYFFP